MSHLWNFFTVVVLLEFLFCSGVSVPVPTSDPKETDAEYVCSSNNTISELKSLVQSDLSDCNGKENDLEFWIASCRCTFEPHLSCPNCTEQSEERNSMNGTSTAAIVPKLTTKSIPVGPSNCTNCHEQPSKNRIVPSAVTVATTKPSHPHIVRHLPTDLAPSKVVRLTSEMDPHAKPIRSANLTSNTHFIRFG